MKNESEIHVFDFHGKLSLYMILGALVPKLGLQDGASGILGFGSKEDDHQNVLAS